MNLGIAITSGTFKGVFGHGILAALEEGGVKADTYACASSSVLSGGLAAVGKAKEVGVSYWLDVRARAETEGMSKVVLYSIEKYGSLIKQGLFDVEKPARLLVATSQVVSAEAEELTQGSGARKLGRQLLIDAMRKNNEWPQKHLKKIIFDSKADQQEWLLDQVNFDEVAYASTRMLHAWEQPAWIKGRPFIDGSYTCACPALELYEKGYQKIIVIAAEPGELYNDIFQSHVLNNTTLNKNNVYFVKPEYDLKTIGVDYTKATIEGMEKAYQYGYEEGRKLLDRIDF